MLTRGVGEARTFRIGAVLLDRAHPTQLLARTPRPILEPDTTARGGYIAHMAYSCGGLVRGRTLLLPYRVADQYAEIGCVDLDA